MSEKLLLDPVSRSFSEMGYDVFSEVPFLNRSIDMYCYKKNGRHSVAVELKVKNWRKAISQTRAYQMVAEDVYVAMPQMLVHRALRQREFFEKRGIGLLSVGGKVEVLIKPRASGLYRPKLAEALSRELLR